MEDELKEYVSWLEEEIEKENERPKNGETKTGIRKWSLIIIKNMILSKSENDSDKQKP